MIVEMVMPRMGEGIVECTVLNILKKVGDTIEADDSVLEVATDKVDTEVPTPHAGIISEILVNINDIIPIGSVVMRVETSGAITQITKQESPAAVEIAQSIEKKMAEIQPIVQSKSFESGSRFYSPLVRTIAQAEGISMNELEQIMGSGAEGRVTKNDILKFVEDRSKKGEAQRHRGTELTAENQKLITDDRQPMDRVRRLIADRMVESKRISAHVTSYVECDMTAVVKWRNEVKDKFKQQIGENLTFTPLLIQATIKAIQSFPNINISVEDNHIIKKPDINIGMAVALPNGNLIVPVIHRADQYDLIGLTKKVNDLANRARNNQLTPEDLTGGTYTVSNIGMFGNLMGTPIIVQPQVAIMAFGLIQKRPVVLEHASGDFIGIRSMMYLSHSYDHRVVDGALGGMFVRAVADNLEAFEGVI